MKFFLFLFLLCFCCGSMSARESGEVVVGGYYDGYPMSKIHPGYTMYFHAFLETDANADILENRRPVPGLAKYGHAQGAVVLLSLGGATPFAAVTEDPEKCSRYVKTVMTEVENGDYDGLDVDWEYPLTPAAGKQWSALMRLLRKELDLLAAKNGRKMLLSTALPPGIWAWKEVDYDVLKNDVDYINIMCYDDNWGVAAYHAPLNADPDEPRQPGFVERLNAFEEITGVDRSKIIVGLPFYGNYFETTESFVPVPDHRWRQLYYYSALGCSTGYDRVYNSNTCGVTAWSSDRTIMVTYDSPQSIDEKTNYYLEQGYAGVFCWAMDRDLLHDGSQPLTAAMITAVKNWRNRQP